MKKLLKLYLAFQVFFRIFAPNFGGITNEEVYFGLDTDCCGASS